MRQNDHHVGLIKTQIVEVNEKSHSLPPDCGSFKEFKVADYFCPKEWSNDGVFIPVKEGQPMWFDFRENDECAVVVSVQRLNPITGAPADLEKGLTKDPSQNYIVVPLQKWLDGYAKDGKVYQFIVTRAGIGLAVNEFVLPIHMQDSHALGFAFYDPKNPKPKTRSIGSCNYSADDIKVLSPDESMRKWALRAASRPTTMSLHTPESWTLGSNSSGGGPGGSSCFSGFSGTKGSGMPVGDPVKGGEVFTSGALSFYDESMGIGACAEADEMGACASSEDEVKLMSIDDVAVDKASMGAGGRIEQRIVTDNNSADYYKDKPTAVLTVYLALPEQFNEIMKRGTRQDASRKDKYIHSGEIGGVQVPLSASGMNK